MSEHIVRVLQGRVFRAKIVKKKNRYFPRFGTYGALELANQIVSRACLSRVVKRASLAGKVVLREKYKKGPWPLLRIEPGHLD